MHSSQILTPLLPSTRRCTCFFCLPQNEHREELVFDLMLIAAIVDCSSALPLLNRAIHSLQTKTPPGPPISRCTSSWFFAQKEQMYVLRTFCLPNIGGSFLMSIVW